MADTTLDLTGNLDIKEPFLKETKKGFSVPVSIPVAKEWLRLKWKNLRPWNVFVNTNNFGVPSSTVQFSQRLVKNIEHFQSNYLFVFLGLVIYCLITSPLLLIAIATSLGACYIIKLKNKENRIKIFGHELNLAQQYILVALCSIPIFLLAGAGSVIFWILGASFFLIMLHATFFCVESLQHEDSFDLTMETI